MRIGAITHSSRTINVRMSDEDVALSVRLTDGDAEQLVGGMLLALAQINPVRWQRVFDDVREVRRS